MTTVRIAAFTLLAMIAFAGNSILCRIALKETGIDAAAYSRRTRSMSRGTGFFSST